MCEPHIDHLPTLLADRDGLTLMEDTMQAIAQAEMVVTMVGHERFRTIDERALDGKIVIDYAGVWR